MKRTKWIPVVTLVLIAAVVLVVAGCGGGKKKAKAAPKTTTSSTTSTTVPTEKTVASIAAEVPANIKSKGTLPVASDATYAPNEFRQGAKVTGMIPDFDTSLAEGR